MPLRMLLVIALFVMGWAGMDGATQCPPAKAKLAEETAAAVRTWRELYAAYREFAVCDDAAIGEAFSDSVCRLLSTHGGRLNELAILVAGDSTFKEFVLKHVDETTPPEQLLEIEKNARYKCPVNSRSVCRDLLDATRELRRRTQGK